MLILYKDASVRIIGEKQGRMHTDGASEAPHGKEIPHMEHQKNPNIHCTVEQCAHNLCTEQFCTLDQVQIGTHEADPSVKECVDCNSFKKRTCC